MSYFSHAWLPYLYQYGLGALIFLVGIILTVRAGAFTPRRRRLHRWWMLVLVGGFVWFLTLHGVLTVAALGHERVALVVGGAVMALTVSVLAVLQRRNRKRA